MLETDSYNKVRLKGIDLWLDPQTGNIVYLPGTFSFQFKYDSSLTSQIQDQAHISRRSI
jgi:hypothetical protein